MPDPNSDFPKSDMTSGQISDSDTQSFTGEIKVASRIIDYLSSGLYHTPAACLKELINNSFDADATLVEVFVKPDADRIIIEDNGVGMSKDEFTSHFDHISESHKRDRDDKTKKGRPKIGKIGIGFIAANELCEILEIFSTKSNSTELLHIIIDFNEMRKPLQERRRENNEIVKADYWGEVLETNDKEQYTKLYLQSIRGEARNILAGASSQTEGKEALSLYGKSAKTIVATLKSPYLNTWKEFDAYSETMLQIGLNVPVAYYPDWIPSRHEEQVSDFEQETARLNFEVLYDGSPLCKPIVLAPPDNNTAVTLFDYQGEHVSAKGYFYIQNKTIRPRDLQGLLVRIRDAAVGEYDHTFWGFSPSEASLIQRWVSAEIWADDRLEDAMNIDRRTLRDAQPAFAELRAAIHRKLRSVLSEGRTKIYKAGSDVRKQNRVEKTRHNIRKLADETVAPISLEAANHLKNIADATAPSSFRALDRAYTVSEFFEIVIEESKGILTPDQLDALLKRLTERLAR